MTNYEPIALPYGMDALTPHISADTLNFHYGKHYKAYCSKVPDLAKAMDLDGKPLEEIVRKADGPLFNNAAQAWNHAFYWHCLSPDGGGEPQAELKTAIDKAFGNFADFKKQFSEAAVTQFGSGWAWLVKEPNGNLAIAKTSNAETPLKTEGRIPLLTCDVWEHAYYLDYQNRRPDYVQAFWNIVNWEYAAEIFNTGKIKL